MAVSRTQVSRADRVGQMRREYVKVLPAIFTKQESFRVKVGNRSDELVIHALDSMCWCQISRPLPARFCEGRKAQCTTRIALLTSNVFGRRSKLAVLCEGVHQRPGHHEMVEHADVDQGQCLGEGPGQSQVGLAGLGRAGRMVVRQ